MKLACLLTVTTILAFAAAIYSKVRDTIEDALHAGMAEDDAHLAAHAAVDAYYENRDA